MKKRIANKTAVISVLLLITLLLNACSSVSMIKGKDYFSGASSAKSASADEDDEDMFLPEEASGESPDEEEIPDALNGPEEDDAVNDSGFDDSDNALSEEDAPFAEEDVISGEGFVEETAADEEGTVPEDTFDIVFFGDSQFENGREDGTSVPNFISNLTRADSLVNLACGGTCAAVEFRQRYRTYNEWVSPNFTGIVGVLTGKISDRILNGYAAKEEIKNFDPEKVDYYVIAYGYNDYQNEHEIFNQEWHQDPSSFAYALMSGINDLRAISPQAKFVVCTPCYSQFFNASGAYIGDGNIVAKGPYGYTLSDFAMNCNAVANDTGSMYFDAYFGSEIDLSSYTADQYLERDGVHLTFRGRNAYAQALAHNINKDRGLDDTEQGIVRISDYR